MFICHVCGSETRTLSASGRTDKKLTCPNCSNARISKPNSGIITLMDKWEGPDGKIHRITKGKQSEIDNRRTHPEWSKAVINRKTGREAQY